jgi:hypothetical protein
MGLFSSKVTLQFSGLIASSGLEAIPAINRFVTARLERNHGVGAAAGADRRIHLTLGTAVESATVAVETGFLFPGGTAGRATSRLIGETLGSKKLLLTGGEGELLIAFLTHFDFVLIHEKTLQMLASEAIFCLSSGGYVGGNFERVNLQTLESSV